MYSNDDIVNMMEIFGLPYNTKKDPIEIRKERLFAFYKSLNLSNCNPWRFMNFYKERRC